MTNYAQVELQDGMTKVQLYLASLLSSNIVERN